MSSNCIYTSEKTLPYVYWLTHKITNEFYVGSRANSKQTLPSHLDILQYKTSSKIVNPSFNEFNIIILAEFLSKEAAYDYEQQLIRENWGNPLLLNKCYSENGKLRWSTINNPVWTGKTHSAQSIEKMKQSQIGKKISEETKIKMSLSHLGKPRGTYSKSFTCPHCNFSGTNQSIKFHFENCNKNPNSKNYIDFSLLSYKVKTCPHCGVTGRDGNLTRYHFGKCKLINPASRPTIICPHCSKSCTSKTTAVRWHFDNCKSLCS